jgi:hypothetical protein
MIAIAIGAALGLALGMSACDDNLRGWHCEENFETVGCTCFAVGTNDFILEESTTCDPSNLPSGGTCCFELDVDGDPGFCKCTDSPTCSKGFKPTKSCSELSRFFPNSELL